MSFAFYDKKVVTIAFGDPGADNKQILLYRAPEKMQVESAYVQVSTAQGSSVGAEMALHNYGTAGTAVEGTVAVGIGGSAVADAIAANTPTAWTIAAPNLDAGDFLYLDYQEEGDYQGGVTSVVLTLRPGQAAS